MYLCFSFLPLVYELFLLYMKISIFLSFLGL